MSLLNNMNKYKLVNKRIRDGYKTKAIFSRKNKK